MYHTIESLPFLGPRGSAKTYLNIVCLKQMTAANYHINIYFKLILMNRHVVLSSYLSHQKFSISTKLKKLKIFGIENEPNTVFSIIQDFFHMYTG